MYRYPVHGGVLATSIPLVELHEMNAEDPAAATWELQHTDAPAPDLRDSILVGEEDIAYGAVVRLFRAGGDLYRVSYTESSILPTVADRFSGIAPRACTKNWHAWTSLVAYSRSRRT